MRDEKGSHEKVRHSFELACAVGHTITVYENELSKLEPGNYDVLGETFKIHVERGVVSKHVRFFLRRVS